MRKTEDADVGVPISEPVTLNGILTLPALKERAAKLPRVMSDQFQTRSNQNVEVTSIIPFSNSSFTKVLETVDDGNVGSINNIYVVEYAKGNGFAIMSADTRLDDVLAYSDNGSFKEAALNPGVQKFLLNIPDYVNQRLASYNPLDSLDPGFEYPVDESILVTSSVMESKGPLIPVRWSCYTPFGNQLGGNTGPTVAAMLQIMCYYGLPASFTLITSQYPPVYENIDLDWETYKTYFLGPILQNDPTAVNAISKLAKSIYTGVTEPNSNKEKELESQSLTKAASTWPVYGYTSKASEDNYYMYGVTSDIDSNRPVMVRGYSNKYHNNFDIYTEPSTWIIDGYKRFYKIYAKYRHWYDVDHNLKRTEFLGYDTITSKYWLHCNWGWDSRGDGYFLSEVFSPSTPEESDNLIPFDGKPGQYRYELKQLTGIRPK